MLQVYTVLGFHLNKQSWRVASFSYQWDRGTETSLLLHAASWGRLTASSCQTISRTPASRSKSKSLQALELKLTLIVPLLWHLQALPWRHRCCSFSLSLVSITLYFILSSPQPCLVSRCRDSGEPDALSRCLLYMLPTGKDVKTPFPQPSLWYRGGGSWSFY